MSNNIEELYFLTLDIDSKTSNIKSKNRKFNKFTTNPLETILKIRNAWFCFFQKPI